MLWRSANRAVVKRGDTFFVFTFLTAEELTFKRYDDSSFSDEDDLWITEHLVEAGSFLARTRIEGPYAPRTPRDEVIVTGLEAVNDAPLLARLLRHADEQAARGAAHAQEAADLRVAKVPGGASALTLPGASTAQEALIERIRRWGDDRAAGLLATLVKFDAVRPGAAATAAFVRGCLLACYRDPPPSAPGPSTPHAELASEVLGHAATLDADADGQERADALRNASQLSRAADAMRLAATLLS